MKKVIYLAAAAIVSLSACNSTKKAGGKSAATLKDTYWKLVELNGKPIKDDADRKEVFLFFSSKENHAGGNGGCNGYGGSYELKDNGFSLRFGNMIRTQMACPGLELEDEYLKVLENTDSYYVYSDTLQLNRARMAPLARFVAVPSKKNLIQ